VSGSQFIIVKLRQWFPPEDPLAAKIARICILREDFLLETQGLRAQNIKELDGQSILWRRIYFFRKLTTTISELASAINRILCDTDFKTLLSKQPIDVQAEFASVGRRMQQGQTVTKEVRNAICAHVLETEVQNALQRIDHNAFGLFEQSEKPDKTYMKFAGELVSEILLSGASQQERSTITNSRFEKITDMFFLFRVTGQIVRMYAKRKGLL
jgi:hypothetical protein